MRTSVLSVVMVFIVLLPVAANAQAGFILGLGTGLLLGGGDGHAGGGVTILYAAHEDTLKAIDPMAIRMVASNTCFSRGLSRDASHRTLGDMFEELLKGRDKKDRTVLQIARVFEPDNPRCASVWFAYVEK